MQAPIQLGALTSEEDWVALRKAISPNENVPVLDSLLRTFRAVGSQSYLLEESYIDRDFSAAYSAFYASLFHPYLKYCRRIHFFNRDVRPIGSLQTAEAVARELEAEQPNYLGFIVLRPVLHAPVGVAIASAKALAADPHQQIEVRATYSVHVLGADLTVEGFPLTQQDTRVGACAQAAIWMAGRHFHRRHGGPWFSTVDINDAALKPTDNLISRSLPAGSDFLTPDNIVRALKAMDRHPVVHASRQDKNDQHVWVQPPQEIVSRYLDSGIPVILGLRPRGNDAVGHAVVAVGREVAEAAPTSTSGAPTWAHKTTHILVHDDQRGIPCRLPVREADRADAYPWTLEADAAYVIVPLPSKVFMTGEVAERLARDYVEHVVDRASDYRERAQVPDAQSLGPLSATDASFFAAQPDALVARTYLTYGWKYKRRALRNGLPDAFKSELINKQLPRYVWVTEFSLPDDLKSLNVCDRRVRAHVVVDATGSRFWDSVLLVQIPGLSLFWTFTAAMPVISRLVLRATDDAQPFFPKVRGWNDFDACAVPG